MEGAICSDNYGMVLNLSTWFCISPLLIYDLRLKTVTLLNTTFSGNLILDFRTDEQDSDDIFSCIPLEERAQSYTLLMSNSTLRIMTITKNIKELVIDSFGQSNFTFTIPKRVLTCTEGNISLGRTFKDGEEPCRLEFSGISGESYFSGDFHRYYSARYIAPLDKITELKFIVQLHILDDLDLTFPFCDSKVTPTFPLQVLDSRNNVIFSLDYVKDADIMFGGSSSTTGVNISAPRSRASPRADVHACAPGAAQPVNAARPAEPRRSRTHIDGCFPAVRAVSSVGRALA